jgi:hypothetical protein
MIGIDKPIPPLYTGPALVEGFVSVWDLHKTLSSLEARDEYVAMYDEWIEEHNIRAHKSIAFGWVNCYEETVVGYYFSDKQDATAYKLKFGL